MSLFRNNKAICLFVFIMGVVIISIPSFAAVQPTVNQDYMENFDVIDRALDLNEVVPWHNFLILGVIIILLFSVGLINYKRN